MCSATSKVFWSPSSPAKSSQSNSHGTSSRCPEELIGRNSEKPWTMPRTMAWRIGTARRRYELAAGEGDLADHQRRHPRARREPLDVVADRGDVEEEALQGAGDRHLPD